MDRRNTILIAAIDDLKAGRPAPLVAIALRCRQQRERGRYCTCTDPLLEGDDLMCGACLLSNRGQEERRVARLVGAHEFVPSLKKHPQIASWFCEVCTMPPDAPRHNGTSEVGRTSWGAEVLP